MRNGTKKAAAFAGLAVLGAALWGLGYRQGAQSGQSDLTAETAEVAEETGKTPEKRVLTVARDLPIVENDAIPALDGRCEARLETSATEIPLGDAVYCRFVERNVAQDGTPAMLIDYNNPAFAEEMAQSSYFLYMTLDEIALESPEIDGKYIFAPELESRYGGVMGVPPQIAVGSGEEYEYGTLAVEFPPLEDWNEPFWRGVREALAAEERVELRMRVAFSRRLGLGGEPARESRLFAGLPDPKTVWTDSKGVFEKKIVLTRRPEAETKRFDEWFAGTPAQFWPERKNDLRSAGTFKLPPEFARKAGGSNVWNQNLRASGRSGVELDGFAQTFDVWNFVRFGNRKPSDPNNPVTVDGWRKLEAEFSPSTVRDEIMLTRLLLEYYSAEVNEEDEAALRRLLAWLDSLDPTQRAAYENAIIAKAWMLNPIFGGGMQAFDGGMSGPAPIYLAEMSDASGLTRNAKSAEDIEIARKWALLGEALGRKSKKAREEAGERDFIPALM